MNHRMEFNFIDFNRDDSVNKEEFEYWLNHPVNLTMQDSQNLILSEDKLILLSQDGPAEVVDQTLIQDQILPSPEAKATTIGD